MLFFFFWGGGGVGLGGQGGCERRTEVFVKIQKKCFFGGVGGGGCDYAPAALPVHGDVAT